MAEEKKSSPELEAAELAKAVFDADCARLDAELKALEVEDRKGANATNKRSRERIEEKDADQKALSDYHHGTIFFDEGVSGHSVEDARRQILAWVRQDRNKDEKRPITIEYSSPGGSVLDGFNLYDVVRRASDAGHHVTTRIAGVAASMAGCLIQAGDTRVIGPESYLHLHEVSAGAIGKASAMMDAAELSKRLTLHICGIYAKRANKALATDEHTEESVHAILDRKEVWLSAEEALDLGFVDEIG